METLYDLLGALPNDDADGLRAAFRRAVKRAHPDINPEDPNAAVKFRRIVRANEILGDVEQRAAYDHLLKLAHLEQEQAAKHAVADKVHKLASGVMAMAGVSVVAVGGYALFVQLSANALTPATATAQAVREPGSYRRYWACRRRGGGKPFSRAAGNIRARRHRHLADRAGRRDRAGARGATARTHPEARPQIRF